MTPNYSAIVRTWNSEKTLAKTLCSLRIQTRPPREVIVVDSGSTDGTMVMAEHFGARILKYPPDFAFNYSKALNIGIAAAATECVLSISSHTVMPYMDTAKQMLDALVRPDTVGVYCVPTWRGRDEAPQKKPGAARLVVIDRDTFDGYNGLWNNCSLFLKSDWAVHPFDETMWAAEDQEWAMWHFRNGGRKTARLEETGTMDLNPRRSQWKAARDHVAVASQCYPDYYKWRTILGRFVNSGCALVSFKRRLFKRELLFGCVLALHRAGLLKFQSQYHAGPPRWLSWLAR
jgi:cellulose synthase/poly-beta-1,6-N-acetylglucosamine synthase-like glycosyltransferase